MYFCSHLQIILQIQIKLSPSSVWWAIKRFFITMLSHKEHFIMTKSKDYSQDLQNPYHCKTYWWDWSWSYFKISHPMWFWKSFWQKSKIKIKKLVLLSIAPKAKDHWCRAAKRPGIIKYCIWTKQLQLLCTLHKTPLL